MRFQQRTADAVLFLVTIVWGSSFVLVKDTIANMGPMTFLSVRFLVAGCVLLAVGSVKEFKRISSAHKPFFKGSLWAGAALFVSYTAQTLGLLTVDAGKAAFLTGIYVALVPLGSRLLLKAETGSFVGVFLATLGLVLMSFKIPFETQWGDLLLILCAVGFAAHILIVERFKDNGSPVLFTAYQLLFVGLASTLAAFLLEKPFQVPRESWGAILFMALCATSFAFLAQTMAQRFTSPTHTALIFATEPVFGALFAWLLSGEVLSPKEILGALCILSGMLSTEFKRG